MQTNQDLNAKKCIFHSTKKSCLETVKSFLQKIHHKKDLNIFLEVFEKESLLRAQKIDQKIKNKSEGRLAGCVIAIKDNICYQGHTTTAASKILDNFESLYSATVVERLIKEDAIIIGRLNCDEFAMGSTNENSVYGPTKNPLNPLNVPGGSSGGSAASVSADLCHLAIGSDTGGSVRQPAAFCGVTGFKPTYGMVSRHGLIAYASSFDQIGPLSKCINTIDLFMQIVSGSDAFDTTCIFKQGYFQKKSSHNINFKVQKQSVLVIENTLNHKFISKEVRDLFLKFLKKIEDDGHIIKYINLPLLDYLVPAYYILSTAEASSNLARYDGIKYGFRSNSQSWENVIKDSRSKGFGNEVKRRILLGSFVLSEGYYSNYYTKAQRVRRLIKEETTNLLNENNFILTPTSPMLPFKIGVKKKDPTEMYLQDVFTVQANLTGNPSISIPIKPGFPIGAQFLGKFGRDAEIISFANYIKKI